MLVSLGGPVGSRPAGLEAAVESAADLESFLRRAEVVDVRKEISGGRSRPWVITLALGEVRHRAMFKHFDYRRPQPQPHSYKYEIAAYELAKLLGVEIVPPVIEREIEGRKGSLQIFLEGCVSEQDRRRKKLEPPDPAAFAKALDGVRVFESLVNDECLNYGDLLVHPEDWRLCRVDFSEAFAPLPNLPEGCPLTACSRKLYQGLLDLDADKAGASLRPFLSSPEIKALLARKDLLLAEIRRLIDDKGEAAVLF